MPAQPAKNPNRLNSPARVNRTVRGGTISAASRAAPPNRRQSSVLAKHRVTATLPGHTWYGGPVFVQGGRHPNMLAGNDDEVNHNIDMFDNFPTAYLLDQAVGVATRLLDGIRPIAHSRNYGSTPGASRDMEIVSDSQRVVKEFAWHVTTATNALLAFEYLICDRSNRNLLDIDAMHASAHRRNARGARFNSPPQEENSAQSSDDDVDDN